MRWGVEILNTNLFFRVLDVYVPDIKDSDLVEFLCVEDEHVHGLLVLLAVHVLAHHGGLHRRQHAQLGTQGRDLLTHLTKGLDQ